MIAEIFQKNSQYFPVHIHDMEHYKLIEDHITKGQRREIYLTRGISSHRYVTVHTTKNNKICSIRGHKSKPCEHKHLIPLHFRGEKIGKNDTFWDIDEYVEMDEEKEAIAKKEMWEVMNCIFFFTVFVYVCSNLYFFFSKNT